MARADALFQLRLPEHLRNKLEEQANKKKQSLTSEILNRLEESFSNDSDKILELVERIAALEKAVFYTNIHPIAKYRMMHKWTQEQLAEKLDLPPNTISNMEKGAEHPSKEIIKKLCRLLEIPIDTLLKELSEFIIKK